MLDFTAIKFKKIPSLSSTLLVKKTPEPVARKKEHDSYNGENGFLEMCKKPINAKTK